MADQFILDLIGQLNKTQTEANIRSQLGSIVKELNGENIPQFIGELDYKTTETNIRKQLDSISKSLTLNINPSIGKSTGVTNPTSNTTKSTDNPEIQKSNVYYKQMIENLKLIQSLKNKQGNAGISENAEIERQIKNAKNRIVYEEQQIQKKNLYNLALQQEVNNLKNVQAEQSKLSISKQLDTSSAKLQSLEQKWKQQGILVGDFKKKVAALKAQLSTVGDSKSLQAFSAQLATVKKQANKLNLSNINNTATAKLTSDLSNLSQKVQIAQSRFKLFQGTLKSDAISKHSNEINNVSTAYQKVNQAIANGNLTGAKKAFTEAQLSATKFRTSMQEMGNISEGIFTKLGKNVKQFANYLASATLVMLPIRMFREAVTTMKEVDTLLTEISKTSNITASNLKKLGLEAFDSANKYGATVQGYLSGVQEMSRAGFAEKDAKQLASLSILAQSAGDMTAELANQYLIATNFAYGYGGSVEKLNAVLDSQNQINKMVCLYGNI